MASDETWPRPCMVDGERRALCWDVCQWARSRKEGGVETLLDAAPVLLVEFENGGFASMPPERVTMLDGERLFDSYCWEVGQ